jgi:NAD(P)-dependent dehydrogenase (short-subunit alcohol dehydrogenase family)
MRLPDGFVALVAGGTRGAGRGIAVELGAAGATVYVTGRSTRGNPSSMKRPETIEDTAELVTAHGGHGVPVRVDHTHPAQVRALVDRIRAERGGRLDLLVNDIWGGDPLTRWGVPFWEHPLEEGLLMQRLGVHTHVVTSWFVAPLLVARGAGLIVEVTDGAGPAYRGNLFYDLAKAGIIRLALAEAADLRPHGVSVVGLTPGFLRSEAVLDHFGVTAQTWQDAIATDPHFAASETPRFLGRAVVALAGDPRIAARSGQTLTSWDLSEEFGFTDVDGTRPHWGRHFARHIAGG